MTIKKFKDAAAKLETNAFITGYDYAQKRKCCFRISTGSAELDRVLGGGVESMGITEVFGEFRTGKTQLAHTLCVTTQMPGIGHQGGKVTKIISQLQKSPKRLLLLLVIAFSSYCCIRKKYSFCRWHLLTQKIRFGQRGFGQSQLASIWIVMQY